MALLGAADAPLTRLLVYATAVGLVLAGALGRTTSELVVPPLAVTAVTVAALLSGSENANVALVVYVVASVTILVAAGLVPRRLFRFADGALTVPYPLATALAGLCAVAATVYLVLGETQSEPPLTLVPVAATAAVLLLGGLLGQTVVEVLAPPLAVVAVTGAWALYDTIRFPEPADTESSCDPGCISPEGLLIIVSVAALAPVVVGVVVRRLALPVRARLRRAGG